MRLNHPGVYRIVGDNFELLANVIGEAPCLRIVNAIILNDFIQKNTVRTITEESDEIQEVINNPDAFVFIEWEYSDVCKLPPYRVSIRGTKVPKISDKEFEEFTQRYISDVSIPGRGISSTKMYIMDKTGWTLSQAHLVVMQIAKKLKKC